jgi:hypothetical protein
MKIFDELTHENFLLYAAKNYYNPRCIDAEEFYEDLKRFKYIKRLITRFTESDQLSVNLMMNHLIIIFNVFDVGPGIKMLEFKLNPEQFSVVKPFLIYLKLIENSDLTGIPMNLGVVEELRKIK